MEGRKFAYARVSSNSQNIDRQLMELRKYVPESQIVIDKASGKNLDRQGYQALKGALGLRPVYIPTTESRLHGVLAHAFRSSSAFFPVW